MARFGVHVTLIQRSEGLLGREEPWGPRQALHSQLGYALPTFQNDLSPCLENVPATYRAGPVSPRCGRLFSMSTPEPRGFADQWVKAWNARDLAAVLAHYADDIVFTSPTALRVVPDSGGTVRGKDALQRYWTLALAGNPDLQFELVGVYAGVATLVLHYRNQLGGLVNEVLTFRDGLVAVGHATHLQA